MRFKGLIFSLVAALLLGACSRGSESVDVFLPRLDEGTSPDAEARRTALCNSGRLSLASFSGEQKFHHTSEFRAFFDCLNYDRKFQSIEPLIYSPSSPRFLDALMDSVNAVTTSERTRNIRDQLAPWFAEHRNTGVARIDHILPIVADVIRNPIFRQGLPLVATLAAEGREVWSTALAGISRLIYDYSAPDLWTEFRKLFNVRRLATDVNHLPLTTREFFQFLRKESENLAGERRTNASMILEMLDDLNQFQNPPEGFIALIEYANNRDIFGTLYQEAGGAARGEEVIPELNGGPGNTLQEQRQLRSEKMNTLFAGGANAPIYGLISTLADFNKPRPHFLSAVAAWFSSPTNKDWLHQGMVDYVARRLIGEAVRELPVSRYLQDYFRQAMGNRWVQRTVDPQTGAVAEQACTRRIECEVSAEDFSKFLADAFAHENFVGFVSGFLDEQNRKQFQERNANLLRQHGGLQRDVLALYRLPQVAEYGKAIVESPDARNAPRVTLRLAINLFARGHIEERSATEATEGGDAAQMPRLLVTYPEGTEAAPFFTQLMNSWQRNSREAWGESIVIQEAFRVVDLFLSELVEKWERDPQAPTLAQWFTRSTYSDPTFMEQLVYQGKRTGILSNLETKIRWLRDELGPQMFNSNPDDLAAFQRLVERIPSFLVYVESGMLRAGTNLTRALSERDRGWLVNTYVNIISEANERGFVRKFVPVWKDFSDFMEFRQNRAEASYNQLEEQRSPEERLVERLREARQQSDGVDALKKVFRQLTRPRVENDWSTSLVGQILVPLRELAKPEKRAETERFLNVLADRTIAGTDEQIEAVWNFFSGENDEEIRAASEETILRDRTYRRELADLMRQPAFSTVLVELDGLFRDRSVAPALDFLAERIERGELARMLELMRRFMGIPGVSR